MLYFQFYFTVSSENATIFRRQKKIISRSGIIQNLLMPFCASFKKANLTRRGVFCAQHWLEAIYQKSHGEKLELEKRDKEIINRTIGNKN